MSLQADLPDTAISGGANAHIKYGTISRFLMTEQHKKTHPHSNDWL